MAYAIQPSPYSGDENPLCPVKRLENAIQHAAFRLMSADELGRIDHVVLPSAKHFLSRFRTRRHA